MNDEIREIVLSGSSLKDLPKIVDALKEFDESELFESLFPISVERQRVGRGVAFSAYALNALNPISNICIEDAVLSLLPEWDISIEEVVFYLVKQYGKVGISEYIDSIKSELEGEELVRAKTIEYWLSKNA